MISFTVVVLNQFGLHARPAAVLVKTASKFKSSITVKRDGRSFNPKNILGVMSINAKYGDELVIEIDGEDEAEATKVIKELFETKFGEF